MTLDLPARGRSRAVTSWRPRPPTPRTRAGIRTLLRGFRALVPAAVALGLAPLRLAAQQPAESAVPVVTTADLAPRGPGARVVETAGSGTPVVIVPGVLGSAYGFRKVIPGLVANGFHVTVVDLLGFGSAPRPSHADYSTMAQADRLAAAIGGNGASPVLLVCHALAGPICLRLAYRHPGLVRGIVSINGGGTEHAGTGQMRFALTFARIVLFFAGRTFAMHRLKDGLIGSSGDPAWVTDEVVDRYAAPFGDLGEVVRSLRAILGAHDSEPLRNNLPRVQAPVLLLYGPTTQHARYAALPPEERLILREGLPRFQEEDVAGAGQYIQEEQPERVLKAIERLRAETQ